MIGDVIEIERAKHALRVVEDAPSIVTALPEGEPSLVAAGDGPHAFPSSYQRLIAGLKQIVGLSRSGEH
jgi:hypothetical protein